jgi:hypothetical protein
MLAQLYQQIYGYPAHSECNLKLVGNTLGYFRNFKNNMFETSVEVYYKDMQNQIEYREGYTPNTLKDTEEDFVFGKGWSYGAEFFVNKVKGRLTGWWATH